jgi:hypothetical protein
MGTNYCRGDCELTKFLGNGAQVNAIRTISSKGASTENFSVPICHMVEKVRIGKNGGADGVCNPAFSKVLIH